MQAYHISYVMCHTSIDAILSWNSKRNKKKYESFYLIFYFLLIFFSIFVSFCFLFFLYLSFFFCLFPSCTFEKPLIYFPSKSEKKKEIQKSIMIIVNKRTYHFFICKMFFFVWVFFSAESKIKDEKMGIVKIKIDFEGEPCVFLCDECECVALMFVFFNIYFMF